MSNFSHRPVTRTLLADLFTPVALYDRLARAPFSYLLESVEGGERWARYSIIGLPAREYFYIKNNKLTHIRNGKIIQETVLNDPLSWVENYQQQFKIAPLALDLPFTAGLVGYFGYDSIGYIESKLAQRPEFDLLDVPDIFFLLSLDVAVLDNLRGEVHLITHIPVDEPEETALQRLDEMEKALTTSGVVSIKQLNNHGQEPPINYHFPAADFKKGVEKVREYLAAGDGMQVVPSQCMSAEFHHQPLDLYRALRITNPSPYMYFLDFGDFHIVGSSPEILARVQREKVTVRPIAGTRKRGATPEEDAALAMDLLADEKEIAEHAMLIDLGRNDIGRVCTVGSVKITEQMVIERYSHVMHIVSNVEGQLLSNLTALDVFKATFPAGTLSGAPKIRAMQIIDEIEPQRRGIYGGAVGYWSFSGNMDLAIAIRTAVIKNQHLYVQAGAGVVFDSIPENEWQETINKAKALIRAASLLN